MATQCQCRFIETGTHAVFTWNPGNKVSWYQKNWLDLLIILSLNTCFLTALSGTLLTLKDKMRMCLCFCETEDVSWVVDEKKMNVSY